MSRKMIFTFSFPDLKFSPL